MTKPLCRSCKKLESFSPDGLVDCRGARRMVRPVFRKEIGGGHNLCPHNIPEPLSTDRLKLLHVLYRLFKKAENGELREEPLALTEQESQELEAQVRKRDISAMMAIAA